MADKLRYNKRRKFIQEDVVLDDFVARQLTDTAYISRAVSQYLRCLGAPIHTVKGQMTADLRHRLGLNTILDPGGNGAKNRADHRHHAVDAVVIAITDKKRLHALANGRGKDVKPPWKDFREDVRRSIGAINVSHRSLRRLLGALHEETFYGATNKPHRAKPNAGNRGCAKGWTESEGVYVRRKPVTEIRNAKHLGKIRDDTIRQILIAHLRGHSVDPEQAANFPTDAFKGKNAPRMPSGVPIRRVRMLEESKTFRSVSDRRNYQNVKPGNNHHIVYRTQGAGAAEKWTGEVVTMWDAVVRARNGRPVVDSTDDGGGMFVMSLALGESFTIQTPEGETRLCVVRKLDQRSRRLDYKYHTDARKAGEINKDNLCVSPERMRQLKARKVTVDPLGRIRDAND